MSTKKIMEIVLVAASVVLAVAKSVLETEGSPKDTD